ncbi:MAG: hypothetical protein E6Q97_19760 [Desulfurellales bacterium]|nr:MAG: hypothetical protein E6Q97_19760 [Desulfurellales bacterium]
MALTALQLETMRDELQRAIFSGARSVTFADLAGGSRSVQYHSLDEMQTALRSLNEQIAQANGTPRIRRRLIYTSKGY